MDCICENKMEWNQKSILCEILAIKSVTAFDRDELLFHFFDNSIVRKENALKF